MKSTRLLILFVVWMFAAPAMAWAQAASDESLTRIDGVQRDESLRSQVLAAEQAVKREDWAEALRAWQSLAGSRVETAPAQLCGLYFDGREGSFEQAKVSDWCRRAAGNGDAAGLYRMGLLYLIGLGVPKNIAQAQAFCGAAQLRDAQVPAKFCLAAIADARALDARATLADIRNQMPAPPRTGTAGANGGAGAREMCERVFLSAGAPFDARAVMKWCGEAASSGDPAALHRMGLMHLFGLGGARDLAVAEKDCSAAARPGQGQVSGAFCFAAVAAARRAQDAAGQDQVEQGPGVDLVTGRPLPGTLPDPFVADRVLDAPHRTAGGLDYTCRKIADWARFEAPGLIILTPRDKLFGKAILSFGRQDFSDLDRAAQACADAVMASADRDRLRPDLDNFRASLVDLKARQPGLQDEHRQARAEAVQLAHDQQFLDRVQKTQMSEVALDASFSTPQEQRCAEELRRGVTGSLIGEKTTLEIRNMTRSDSNGTYVVRGSARVDESDGELANGRDFAPFTCTFVGHTEKIATSTLLPPPSGLEASPALQSAGAKDLPAAKASQ